MSEDAGAVNYGGPESVSFDDIAARNTETEQFDPNGIKLEGDAIPEAFRGKSVAELVALASGQQKALEISENARLALKNSQEALEASRGTATAPAPAPAATPEPEHTEEELRELYDKDPFAYQQLMNDRLEKRILGNVQQRLAPVVDSSVDRVIRDARSQYPDDFAALGQDIERMISQLPDRRVLSAPGAMDDLVAFVRGKNIQKYVAHINSKGTEDLNAARREAGEQTPTEFNRTPVPPRPRGNSQQLDETEKAVADALGVSHADYAKNKTSNRG